MHARLALDENGSLYAGDSPPHMHLPRYPWRFDPRSTYDSVQGRPVFNALADGGKVTMPSGHVLGQADSA